MKTVRLTVDGMSCEHCVRAVEGALKSQDGVRAADVKLDSGAAQVQYEETRVTPEQMIAAVKEEGYEARIGS